MITTVMKWVAIAALVVGIFWRMSLDQQSYLNFVIAAGAVFVMVQAFGLGKYWWIVAFVAITCLFNPIEPIGFSSKVMIGLQIMCAAAFAVSLQFLHTEPRMTIASITEANPKTESL
jgi:hypothetical protein